MKRLIPPQYQTRARFVSIPAVPGPASIWVPLAPAEHRRRPRRDQLDPTDLQPRILLLFVLGVVGVVLALVLILGSWRVQGRYSFLADILLIVAVCLPVVLISMLGFLMAGDV